MAEEKKIALELGSEEMKIVLALLQRGRGIEYDIEASRARVALYDRLVRLVNELAE